MTFLLIWLPLWWYVYRRLKRWIDKEFPESSRSI